VISVIFLLLLLHPSFISAHAYIIKSEPFDNEILKQPLHKVSIQFDETIQSVHNSIKVYDAKGNRVDQKNGHVNAKNSTILECGLNQSLPNGTYRIQWNVISNDGHPVQGVIPFQIEKGNKSQGDRTVSHQESKGYTPHFDLIIIRWIQYFSNACFVGIQFFRLFVMPKELLQNVFVKNTFSKIINFSFLFLFLSIFLNLPLMATIELTTSWSNALNIQTLMDLVDNTTFGTTWVIQLAVLFFLAIITWLLIAKKVYNPFWSAFLLFWEQVCYSPRLLQVMLLRQLIQY
jgi:copper transport protein